MDKDEFVQPEDYFQASLGVCDGDIMLLDVYKDGNVYLARLLGDSSGREWELWDEAFDTKEEAFEYGKERIKVMKEFFVNLNLKKIRMPK